MDKKKANDKINQLVEKELDECKKQLEEYKNKYLRSLADYQNLEKRINNEKEELKKELNKNLILKILTILDDIDKAEIFIKDVGLKIIKDKFIQLLRNEGVEEIDLNNGIFDPNLAEAVEVVEGKEDNKIVEVLRKGYKYQGKVIRVALVKVSKKKIPTETEKIKQERLKGDDV
jgi:molecular chaperone GrpE